MDQTTSSIRLGSPYRRITAVAVAAATLGVVGASALAATEVPAETAAPAVAIDRGSDAPCRPNEGDLLRAAYEARKLEALRPELFEDGTRSRYEDLRLAAEWASRLEVLAPELVC